MGNNPLPPPPPPQPVPYVTSAGIFKQSFWVSEPSRNTVVVPACQDRHKTVWRNWFLGTDSWAPYKLKIRAQKTPYLEISTVLAGHAVLQEVGGKCSQLGQKW
jgi:hypothetical protein